MATASGFAASLLLLLVSLTGAQETASTEEFDVRPGGLVHSYTRSLYLEDHWGGLHQAVDSQELKMMARTEQDCYYRTAGVERAPAVRPGNLPTSGVCRC
ncbi:hypothetical protein FKM82_026214 [Ascaphus truei]